MQARFLGFTEGSRRMTLTIGSLCGGSVGSRSRYHAYWNNDGTVCVKSFGDYHVQITWRELEKAIEDARQGRTGQTYDATREMGMLSTPEHVTISIDRKGVIEVVQHGIRPKKKRASLHVIEWEKILNEIKDGHGRWNREAGIAPLLGPVYLPDGP